MEERNDSKPPPRPPQPPTLNYASPDSRPAMPYPAQVALGFVAYLVFGGLILASIGITEAPPALLGPFMLLLLLGATAWLHKEKRWIGFTAGVLLGFGLSCLAFGICFIVVMRSFG